MKRLLSLILAAAMVLSLLPVFASAEDAAVNSNDVIIDFDALPAGNTTTEAGLSTDGFEFVFNHMGLTTNSGYPGIEWRNNNTTNGVLRVTLASTKLWPANPTNRIAALDVTVPEDGYYSVKFQGGLSNVSSKTSIFIDSTYASGKYSGGQYVGDYDFTTDDAATSSATAIDGTEKTLNTVYLTAGTHTIMFLHRTADTSTVYLFFKKLSFIYEGTEAPTATDVETKLPTENMEVGDTENLTATVKMSDGSTLYLGDYLSDGTADTVNVLDITSENPDVIEVSNAAKGGLCNSENTAYTITAKSGGVTNIVYTVSLDGAEPVEIKKAVSVNGPIVIDFTKTTNQAESTPGYTPIFENATVAANWSVQDWLYDALRWNLLGEINANGVANIMWPGGNRRAAFKVNIPESGYYAVKILGGLTLPGGDMSIYADDMYLGDYSFYTTDSTTTNVKPIEGAEKSLNTVWFEKGEHTFNFYLRKSYSGTDSTRIFIYNMSFIPQAVETLTPTAIETSTPSAMEIGDSKNLTATVKMSDGSTLYLGDYLSIGTADTENALSVTSESPDVVEVSEVAKGGLCNSENTAYTITAKSGGTASLVYTLSLGGETVKTWTKSVTVNEETVKLYAYALDGNGTVSVNSVTDVAVDKPTKVTATPDDGYEFAYWTNASGDFVSESASYTFTPYTNTVLCAVFKSTAESAAEETGVDFFDGNRDWLGFVKADAGTLFGELTDTPTPGITGYQFLNWSLDNNTEINGRLSAVALYEKDGNAVSGAVTISGNPVNSPKYGAEVSDTAADAKVWKRTIGGEEVTVGYGEAYTYYIWDATAITSSTTTVAVTPLVVLDDYANGAYMIEYDDGNCTALEAGIIFGSSAEITVDSCYTKAKTREIKSHGQFTAKAEGKTSGMETYARGYLIYKDGNGVVKTIYTDAVAIEQ